MDLVKPELPGWLLSLNYLRLDLLLHLHPLHPVHLQGQLQPHSEQIDIMILLCKDACCVRDGLYCCDPLYKSLICEPWSLITLGELKRRTWSCHCVCTLTGEVQCIVRRCYASCHHVSIGADAWLYCHC